jgi:hypothetical protein
MKTYKKILHWWIAIASAMSFLGGWIILAHSPKPVSSTSSASSTSNQASSAYLPTLAPLNLGNTSGSGLNTNLNNTQTNPGLSSGMPLLRTRGS